MSSASVTIRELTDSDTDAVLALNEGDVQYLAPLDAEKLERFRATASALRIAEVDSRVAGFVFLFLPADDYWSPNFHWFKQRYERFIYLDRIVVSPAFRRQGVAQAIYDMAEDMARSRGEGRVLCEVNIVPPNEGSLAFHYQRGYTEVGRSESPGKILQMLAKEL